MRWLTSAAGWCALARGRCACRGSRVATWPTHTSASWSSCLFSSTRSGALFRSTETAGASGSGSTCPPTTASFTSSRTRASRGSDRGRVILLLIGYLALAWATGFGLTFVSRLPWELEGRLAMGVPLGFGAAAMLTCVLSVPFGMSGYAVAAGALALALVLVACARWTAWREPLASETVAMARRWRGPQALPLALLLLLGGSFFIPFYAHALELSA